MMRHNDESTAPMITATPHDELISVVMPCYNSAEHLESAVASVMEQTHRRVELLLVDDGSTDDSRDIAAGLVRAYGDRMRVFHQQNQGPFPARNLALHEARGRYIAFLDSDDYWDPTCLEKLLAALHKRNADLTYCGWQNVGARTGAPYVPPCYEEGDIVARFLKSCPWPIHGVLVRREIIEAVNGFSERYFSAMDYDLWMRIIAVTRNIALVPEVLAYYRWHNSGQISANQWRQTLDAWNVRRDFLRNNPELVAHIDRKELRQLVDGCILDNAYRVYWKRDLAAAQKLFRIAFRIGTWRMKDLKYVLPALLPQRIYRDLIARSDTTA